MIKIDDDGLIKCSWNGRDDYSCNTLGMFNIGQHCGDCPLIQFGFDFMDLPILDGLYGKLTGE